MFRRIIKKKINENKDSTLYLIFNSNIKKTNTEIINNVLIKLDLSPIRKDKIINIIAIIILMEIFLLFK